MRRLLQRIVRTFRRTRRVRTRVAALPLEHPYREWLSAWAALWSVPDLPSKAHIVFSHRLTAALGASSTRTVTEQLDVRPGAYMLSTVCFDPVASLPQTVQVKVVVPGGCDSRRELGSGDPGNAGGQSAAAT